MIDRCLGVQRSRKVRRALRNCKVTILCLVLTVVVLRSIIGAGKFGTPEQDLIEIRNRFYLHSRKLGAESHRVLKDDRQTTSASSNTSNTNNSNFQKANNNYNEFDTSNISVDEEEDENPDWHKPYSVGPKISDWDERRSKWLKENPKFLNFVGEKKPRVLLVTGSSPGACETPVDAEMAGFWAKLPLLRNLMLSHPEVELFWWMDSDAMFTDMAFEVPWDRAGKILTKELKDRPAFEADDQSAMVYLLATQRDKWGDKVYLESEYYLHGYWGILVDRYEEMIDKYHPGLGDHRWPLVTHFVGCKPCAKFGELPVERCLRQMDRAFNFGDNQILKIYGFTHNSLVSKGVKRVRNETSNLLEVKDQLGLLQSPFKKAIKVSPLHDQTPCYFIA
ncbi:hypothetical protein Patl1_01023 [Pistacia atlantica]|uniref:Uncharacterized protein n=1 Tax=Pistacia atlantica TaxID=434234 RepID=A0ACC1C7P7_9ROSI|nr:hypothetical protein Patl1_01023 [Pistacia atlantica]